MPVLVVLEPTTVVIKENVESAMEIANAVNPDLITLDQVSNS